MSNFFWDIVFSGWLGILCAISPCPLAGNIAAVGFLTRQTGKRRQFILYSLLYVLGRMVTYVVIGMLLVSGIAAAPGLSYVCTSKIYGFAHGTVDSSSISGSPESHRNKTSPMDTEYFPSQFNAQEFRGERFFCSRHDFCIEFLPDFGRTVFRQSAANDDKKSCSIDPCFKFRTCNGNPDDLSGDASDLLFREDWFCLQVSDIRPRVDSEGNWHSFSRLGTLDDTKIYDEDILKSLL